MVPNLVIFFALYLNLPASNGIKTGHNETERCYWLGTGSKTWNPARTACQSEGGDLAVMETEELWNFVNGVFRYNLFLKILNTGVLFFLKNIQC